ncbi:hypothetical protein JWJ90_09315 [Desulfobulbus rhabdoformis]|uniref:hypothetical protein n=1 Tax=Desulfobulbus rhabdoformis TaxID=34032 RepID=UPI001963EC9D|nr:hypothetical protein [Desulfobulbus rhabdoformis]MBM9614488.1 hypothetical protein [Desulfobulbus rhabdoformis]
MTPGLEEKAIIQDSHEFGSEFEPKAKCPTPGSVDVCFLTSVEIEGAKSFIEHQGVEII